MIVNNVAKQMEYWIANYGFTFEYEKGNPIPFVKNNRGNYCRVSIIKKYEAHDNNMLYITIIAKAGMCRMDSEMSTDEMRNIADEMVRAANLVDKINSMSIAYRIIDEQEAIDNLSSEWKI